MFGFLAGALGLGGLFGFWGSRKAKQQAQEQAEFDRKQFEQDVLERKRQDAVFQGNMDLQYSGAGIDPLTGTPGENRANYADWSRQSVNFYREQMNNKHDAQARDAQRNAFLNNWVFKFFSNSFGNWFSGKLGFN